MLELRINVRANAPAVAPRGRSQARGGAACRALHRRDVVLQRGHCTRGDGRPTPVGGLAGWLG